MVLGNLFVVFSGSWWLLGVLGSYCQFLVVHCGSWQFLVVLSGFWWFLLVLDGSWWFLLVLVGSWI